jgi:hypothetical protein
LSFSGRSQRKLWFGRVFYAKIAKGHAFTAEITKGRTSRRVSDSVMIRRASVRVTRKSVKGRGTHGGWSHRGAK